MPPPSVLTELAALVMSVSVAAVSSTSCYWLSAPTRWTTGYRGEVVISPPDQPLDGWTVGLGFSGPVTSFQVMTVMTPSRPSSQFLTPSLSLELAGLRDPGRRRLHRVQ